MTEEQTGQPEGQAMHHSLRTKAKKEKIRDRIFGAVMIAAGIVVTVIGIRDGHIPMLWPVVGLAGISLFVDSFLERKPVKIALNVAIIIALAVVYFSVRNFNATGEPAATDPQNTHITE